MSDKNSKSDNRLVDERREKLTSLREGGFNYPSTIEINSSTLSIIDEYDSLKKEDLEGIDKEFSIAGRMMAKRVMGKSSFSRIKDGKGSIQVFLSNSDLGDEASSPRSELLKKTWIDPFPSLIREKLDLPMTLFAIIRPAIENSLSMPSRSSFFNESYSSMIERVDELISIVDG